MDAGTFGAGTFLEAARDAREVRVVVRDGDDETRTPIWIVTTGGGAYIRSYRATEGHWYRHVLAARRFPLELAGAEVMVDAEPVAGPEVLAEVSQAYLAKYAGEPETPDMVSLPVVATTLHLTPASI